MSASGSEAAARAARDRAAASPRRESRDPEVASPRLAAVAGNGPTGGAPARVVVFLGVADDVRSRVAAALLGHRSKGRVRAVSASPVAVDPDPAMAAALAELGVDLGLVATQPPSAALLDAAELVVVMGYDEHDLGGGRRAEDWCIDDPRNKDAAAVRCIRDAIDRRVRRLLIRMGVALPTRPH
jgi:arsenate reductase (thioredoxin)